MITHTILYVKNQKASTRFYQELLNIRPRLEVTGMTEIALSPQHILGLMPESGIEKLLKNEVVKSLGMKAELYFKSQDFQELFVKAIELGARELSPIQKRDWGDQAGYVIDPDGYVLVFASHS